MSDLDMFRLQTGAVRDFVKAEKLNLVTELKDYGIERPILVKNSYSSYSLGYLSVPPDVPLTLTYLIGNNDFTIPLLRAARVGLLERGKEGPPESFQNVSATLDQIPVRP